MLSTRLLARGALLVSAIALSSCASSTGNGSPSLMPGSPLSGGPIAGANTPGRGFFATYVKVDFHNATRHKLNVITAYSYPIIPGWVTYEKQCVHPNSDWTSTMGFDFPDPQVRIVVHNDDCHRFQPIGSGQLSFKDIQFSEDRATITSQVTQEVGPLDFCARQSHPTNGKRECVKIKSR